jgi:DNA-binding response OmpR family regulator
VVDDDSDVCFMLQKALAENGYIVDSFEDPLLALKRFRAQLYNLVILDIKMPKLNGFLLYREMRRLDKKVKICFFTAGEMYYGIYSDIFSSLPANCFIRKPINIDELLRHLNEIMTEEAIIQIRS